MSAPALSFGGTTVTLPKPSAAGANDRTLNEHRVDRWTLGGYLRVSRISYGWTYHLAFTHELVSTYDAIVALWNTAVAAGAYPTFAWNADGANKPWGTLGITVALTISPMATKHDFSRTDWTLTLQEVNPR